MIYSYGEDECGSCIAQDIDLLKDLFSNSKKRIFIFPVMDASRNGDLKLRTDLYGFNYKRLNTKDVSLPSLGGKTRRFFAVVTSEGELSNYFFPSKELPNKTKQYIDFVKTKYNL